VCIARDSCTQTDGASPPLRLDRPILVLCVSLAPPVFVVVTASSSACLTVTVAPRPLPLRVQVRRVWWQRERENPDWLQLSMCLCPRICISTRTSKKARNTTITRTWLICNTGLVFSYCNTHTHTELAKIFYHELASRTAASTSKDRWKEGGGGGSNCPPVVLALDSAFVETQNGLPTELPVSMVRCSSIVVSPCIFPHAQTQT